MYALNRNIGKPNNIINVFVRKQTKELNLFRTGMYQVALSGVLLQMLDWGQNPSLLYYFPFTGMNIHTVKPAHVGTSIKQSPVLKGHFFLSYHRKFHMNWTSFKRSPVLSGHFLLYQCWPLSTGLTMYIYIYIDTKPRHTKILKRSCVIKHDDISEIKKVFAWLF